MRLFFVFVCCLAIPLVARAADQDGNKKKKQTTQGGQQQQTGKQSMHQSANTVSQLNNVSQLKSHSDHHGLNAQTNNVSAVQSSTKGKLETRHFNLSNSPSQLKSHSDHRGLSVQNNNVSAMKSNATVKLQTKHSNLSNSSLQLKGHRHGLNAQNNNVPAVQSNATAKVQSQHFNLANSPNPRIESAKFNQNYRIQGNENWKGQQYVAFQNYRGEWHDQGWWHSHYNRIILISGGWYFWNAGYWCPAWGYDQAFAYYPYNGPIYAYNNLPPDQVVANVQSALQAQGYYHGEVDGSLGPITRAALASYQRNHGLYMTSAIDEPTLDSLGMS